jgi:hypothetical protein
MGAFDLLQDVGCFSSPDERLGVLIVQVDVVVDGGHELFDAAEDSATQPVLSQVAEEPLDAHLVCSTTVVMNSMKSALVCRFAVLPVTLPDFTLRAA